MSLGIEEIHENRLESPLQAQMHIVQDDIFWNVQPF